MHDDSAHLWTRQLWPHEYDEFNQLLQPKSRLSQSIQVVVCQFIEDRLKCIE